MNKTPIDGTEAIVALLTKEGDTICFADGRFNYVVEEVDTTPTARVRHRHGNDTASSSYRPGEVLYVRKGNSND